MDLKCLPELWQSGNVVVVAAGTDCEFARKDEV